MSNVNSNVSLLCNHSCFPQLQRSLCGPGRKQVPVGVLCQAHRALLCHLHSNQGSSYCAAPCIAWRRAYWPFEQSEEIQ